MKIAFMFSGQGAQYVGMGKEFYEKFQESKEIFQRADNALGFKISDVCFEENENLNITEFTQPAILTTSIAILEVLKTKGIKADYAAGLSLGEYSALVAAESLDFEDAVKVVRNRGKYMSEAVPAGEGAMTAVLSSDVELIQKCCDQASTYGVVSICNYNCPGQFVIGGNFEAVKKTEQIMKENGIKKIIPLNVSGPFHTSLLKPAADKLAKDLENVTVKEPSIPVISNFTGKKVETADNIKDLLVKQVYNPVLWEDSMRLLIGEGVDTFIEIGPGKALVGFMKKIDKDVRMFNVENIESLEKLLKDL